MSEENGGFSSFVHKILLRGLIFLLQFFHLCVIPFFPLLDSCHFHLTLLLKIFVGLLLSFLDDFTVLFEYRHGYINYMKGNYTKA